MTNPMIERVRPSAVLATGCFLDGGPRSRASAATTRATTGAAGHRDIDEVDRDRPAEGHGVRRRRGADRAGRRQDFLGAEAIARVGDSTVSAALRRIPGLTLVNDQFIYVRGLGERYSSVQLNGAQVPSPDLTRNVIPLDIFPTEIIEALQVQKGYSPEVPAAFGGGNVNIQDTRHPEWPRSSTSRSARA